MVIQPRHLILVVILGTFISLPAQAQKETSHSLTDDQNELKQRLDKRLKSKFLAKSSWSTDFQRAKQTSQENGKLIFAYFSRTFEDCPLCGKFDELFLDDGFVEWSDEFIRFAHFTTGIKNRKNENLFRDLRIAGTGYPPAIAILDPSGNVLATLDDGGPSLAKLKETVLRAKKFLKIQQRVLEGKLSQQELFLAKLELRHYSFSEATTKYLASKKKLSKEIQAKAEQLLVDVHFQESKRKIIYEQDAKLKAGMAANEYMKPVTQLHLDFFRANRIPSGLDGVLVAAIVMKYARETKNLELYNAAFELHDELSAQARLLVQPKKSGKPKKNSKQTSLSSEQLDQILAEASNIIVKRQEVYKSPEKQTKRKPNETLEDWQRREQKRLNQLYQNQKSPSEWPYESELSFEENKIKLDKRVACTAICCKALLLTPGFAKSAERKKAVIRATEFILKQLVDNPKLGKIEGPLKHARWSHPYALDFFLTAIRTKVFNKEIEARCRRMIPILIERIEHDSAGWPFGGWHYSHGQGNIGDPCCPFMTGVLLLSLFQANADGYKVDSKTIENALNALAKCRTKGGTFVYSGGYRSPEKSKRQNALSHMATPAGACARTPVSELCLYLAGRSDVKKLEAAIEIFFKHQDELKKQKNKWGAHQLDYGVAPYYFMFAHTYVAYAIEALPAAKKIKFRAKIANLVIKSRDSDGGWTDTAFPRNKSYGTAMAILALAANQAGTTSKWRPKK